MRNWQILSWVGHNIFGNRDGLVLDDPANKASKIQTKDQVISRHRRLQAADARVASSTSSRWTTGRRRGTTSTFKGFLGTKMILQFIWQGCDSLLAGPLVLDLARLALLAQRRGEVGVLRHLACFFKSPMGVQEHDFFKQFAMLEEYVRECVNRRTLDVSRRRVITANALFYRVVCRLTLG